MGEAKKMVRVPPDSRLRANSVIIVKSVSGAKGPGRGSTDPGRGFFVEHFQDQRAPELQRENGGDKKMLSRSVASERRSLYPHQDTSSTFSLKLD